MIIPLPGYVLIEPLEAENTTVSGLHIPDSAQDKPMKGKILEVGTYDFKMGTEFRNYTLTEFLTFNPAVEVGQTVIFKKWSAQDVTDDDKELKLVAFGDILGVIE
jgi:chaperonin GroES